MSNFSSYVKQLKVQRFNRRPSVSNTAKKMLAAFAANVMEKTGRDIDEMTKDELDRIPFDINEKNREHRKFWGVTGKLSYEESAHFLGIFGKKHRAKRKALGKKIGGVVKQIGSGIKKLAGKVLTAPAMAALLPFKGAMKKALNKRNIAHGNDLGDIARKFAATIIKKKNYDLYCNYEQQFGHLLPLAAAGPAIGPAMEIVDKMKIGDILKMILDFFKNLLGLKGKGEADAEDLELIAEVDSEQEKLDRNPEYHAAELEKLAGNSGDGGAPKSNNIMYIMLAIAAIILLRK
jgi:hypothetical protein